MAVVAIQVADISPVLESPHPEVEKIVTAAKADNARALLRYQAWTLSKTLFLEWGFAQLVLGPLTLWLLLAHMRPNKLVAGSVATMIVLACFAQFVIGPELAYKGRALDIGAAKAGDAGQYAVLRLLYIAIEALKVVWGAGVAVYLFRYQARRVARAEEPAQTTAVVASGSRRIRPEL